MRLPTRLSRRKADSNKGDYGHLLVIAGSSRFSGAALLSGEAALRSGAGIVTLGIPASINNALIRRKIPELITLPLDDSQGVISSSAFKTINDYSKRADVLLIGPGLECTAQTRALVKKVIAGINLPQVIDADGLNVLAGDIKILRSGVNAREIVITPHPGEMARLTGLTVKQVQANRKQLALDFAGKYKLTVVLKGYQTVVASADGKVYINHSGNPGMATAGSGDVLAGMLAAFIGQGLDAFDAAKAAVYLHGLAGDLAAREKTKISLIASDIIDKIPKAMKRVLAA